MCFILLTVYSSGPNNSVVLNKHGGVDNFPKIDKIVVRNKNVARFCFKPNCTIQTLNFD